jgi:hypothetical protein
MEALVAIALLPGINAGDDGTVHNDRSLSLQTNFSKTFDLHGKQNLPWSTFAPSSATASTTP